MDKFNGVPISICPTYRSPKVCLSHTVTVSADFRRDFDEWLAEEFGCKLTSAMADGEVVQTGNMLVMNQKTYETLSAKLKEPKT